MNNNQFKRFIREIIEALCKNHNLIPIYIDTTANSRIYYIYYLNYKIKCTINIWIGNNNFSIAVSYSKDTVVNIANRDFEFSGNYLELDTLLKMINDIIGREETNDC